MTTKRKKRDRKAPPVQKELKGKAALVIFGTGARDSYVRLNGHENIITLFVDAGSELMDKGLDVDCERVISIDYYIPEGLTTYEELERYVTDDDTFGKVLKEARRKIFSVVSVEGENWEHLKTVKRDTLGGGGLIYFGVLRLLAAMVGRKYQPNKVLSDNSPNHEYDMRDDSEPHPKLKKRDGAIWVSMYDDIWDVFDTNGVDFVVFEGGFDGATGSSGTFLSMEVFGTSAQISTVPLLAVALPEYFMIDGTIHADHADRLAQTTALFNKVCVIAGLGGEGIFWQAVIDNMRTWAGIYSNLEGIALRRKCAPVLLIGICTHRPDVESRWIIRQLVIEKTDPARARYLLMYYAGLQAREDGSVIKEPRITFEPVEFGRGHGVRVRSNYPNTWKIHELEELVPALACAGRHVGNDELMFPCKVKVLVKRGGFFGIGDQYEVRDENLQVESVPILKTFAKAAGKETLDAAMDDTGFWSLTMPEIEAVRRNRQLTFDQAFEAIAKDFKADSRDYLYNELFPYKITPPSSFTYDTPQTVVVWAQPDLSVEELADHTLDVMFAKVDRSAEEEAEEAERRARESRRRKAVQSERKNRLLR